MVSFQCEGCNDVIKKPKLDNHYQRCGAPVSCVDCSVTFPGPKEWKGHTSCVTEAEKYQKSLYKGPKLKKDGKGGPRGAKETGQQDAGTDKKSEAEKGASEEISKPSEADGPNSQATATDKMDVDSEPLPGAGVNLPDDTVKKDSGKEKKRKRKSKAEASGTQEPAKEDSNEGNTLVAQVNEEESEKSKKSKSEVGEKKKRKKKVKSSETVDSDTGANDDKKPSDEKSGQDLSVDEASSKDKADVVTDTTEPKTKKPRKKTKKVDEKPKGPSPSINEETATADQRKEGGEEPTSRKSKKEKKDRRVASDFFDPSETALQATVVNAPDASEVSVKSNTNRDAKEGPDSGEPSAAPPANANGTEKSGEKKKKRKRPEKEKDAVDAAPADAISKLSPTEEGVATKSSKKEKSRKKRKVDAKA